MPFPTILVNSSTGTSNASGATASGAGPGTALTGSAGVTANNGGGTTARRIELDGSPDLTNVATDGSHALYFHDTTAGRRRWVAIEGKGNSGSPTAYVDVVTAMGGGSNGVSAAWAIGGKLSGIEPANHRLLFLNNSSAGDCLPGWIVEFDNSGYAETLASTLSLNWTGTGLLPIILRGKEGLATKPVLTFSNNGNAIALTTTSGSGHFIVDNIDLLNSHGTKTSSVALQGTGSGDVRSNVTFRRLRIGNSSGSHFWKGFVGVSTSSNFIIEECDITHCANVGIDLVGTVHIYFTKIHDGASVGISFSGSPNNSTCNIVGCLIYANSSHGISGNQQTGQLYILNNIVHGNGGSGYNNTVASGLPHYFSGNIWSSNGGYGKANDASALLGRSFYEAYYNNTSGEYNTAPFVEVGKITLSADPFVDAANGDFNLNNDAGGGALLRAATLTMPG